ncbi:FAD-dependent oxidoreductase [Amycolatopsis jejuensis]|uniref:FAD-dependent oxidoreductase n=1 Tax=Amycolatopsis jejuensis TaxID=330084 RepID=UPI0005269AF9|nr:NAD(P)/FAD-dependent oxidoreductase [Amycolatopsis jejuensis]
MSKTDHVVIIGAGVAGLAAAVSLDMAGVRATVYEGRCDNTDTGISFVIRESGLRVLGDIGVLDAVRKHSFPMPKRFFTPGCPGYTENDWADYGTGNRSISREDLLGILRAEVRHRAIEVCHGKRLHSLQQHPESVVASFADGTRAESDLLIGADGRSSVTRGCIFPSVRLQHARAWCVYGHSGIDDLDPASRTALEEGAGLVMFDAELGFLAYRDDPQLPRKVTWMLFGGTERKIPTKSFELVDREMLMRELEDGLRKHSPVAADIVAATLRVAPTQVFTLPALPAWSAGRVALIGDAAHPVDPIIGAGTAFALEDAIYVAKMLREHHYLDAFYYLHADRHHRVDEMIARSAAGLEASMRLATFEIGWDLPDEVTPAELVPAPNR